MPARRAISASRTRSIPSSVIRSRDAFSTRSRLTCPCGVLPGPRRLGGGALTGVAGGPEDALLACRWVSMVLA